MAEVEDLAEEDTAATAMPEEEVDAFVGGGGGNRGMGRGYGGRGGGYGCGGRPMQGSDGQGGMQCTYGLI